MVKKTAISQAKSSITSEHTRNTCGLASAAPLKIEKERQRERERERERDDDEGICAVYVRGKERAEQSGGKPESTEFFSANRLLN